ncbi:MAG: YdcF family protein [Erythrobacter sp.]
MKVAIRWFKRIIAVVAVWLICVGAWIGIGPQRSTDIDADTAIVLGAAVDDNQPSPVFAARIDQAVELYRKGAVQTLLFTGGKSDGDSLSEANAAREYAINAGIPARFVHLESRSRTTQQNLANAQAVMGNAGLETAVIVSDPLHLRRAMVMSDELGIDAQPYGARQTRYRSWRTKLPFVMREVYFLHHYWLFGE